MPSFLAVACVMYQLTTQLRQLEVQLHSTSTRVLLDKDPYSVNHVTFCAVTGLLSMLACKRHIHGEEYCMGTHNCSRFTQLHGAVVCRQLLAQVWKMYGKCGSGLCPSRQA